MDDWTGGGGGGAGLAAPPPPHRQGHARGGAPPGRWGGGPPVVRRALLRGGGVELEALVDADIAACPEAYPHITTPDPNIDFRRVNTLDTFFRRHAQVLTCDLSDGQQWQPGDIVVFGDRAHIGLCSDRRNRQGIPFLIHHGNPIDEAVERNDIPAWR